jgi:Family of unknown function (DUF6505)
MRFPRAIRLDVSDEHVYGERAARPGEPCVPGGFAFAGVAAPEALPAKTRQAFASAFLGTETFGFTTLVQVADLSERDHRAVVDRLTAHLLDHYGAPDAEAARRAAEDEVAYAAELCAGHDAGTLLAVEREPAPEGVRERFRVIRPRTGLDHSRVWTIRGEE